MSTLKQEEVRNLSPEEQTALAHFEAEWVRTRQRLIAQAELSAPRDFVAGFLAAIAAGLAIFGFVQPKAIPIAILAAIAFVVIYIKGIHNRLNALMQLLNSRATLGEGRNPKVTQPAASPKGGPATPSDNSGMREGPPSGS